MNMTLYIIHKLILNATGFRPNILFDNMIGIEACVENIFKSREMIFKFKLIFF